MDLPNLQLLSLFGLLHHSNSPTMCSDKFVYHWLRTQPLLHGVAIHARKGGPQLVARGYKQNLHRIALPSWYIHGYKCANGRLVVRPDALVHLNIIILEGKVYHHCCHCRPPTHHSFLFHPSMRRSHATLPCEAGMRRSYATLVCDAHMRRSYATLVKQNLHRITVPRLQACIMAGLWFNRMCWFTSFEGKALSSLLSLFRFHPMFAMLVCGTKRIRNRTTLPMVTSILAKTSSVLSNGFWKCINHLLY